jgi:hypothetical protein
MMYAWIGSVVAALLGGMYIGGYWNEAGHSLETIAEQKEVIRIDASRDEVTAKADKEAVTTQKEIVTVFKDRWHYITKEVPVEVIKEMDAECIVPNHFISLWDGANQGIIPDAASGVDVSPSGIKLSDISEQKETESEICIANTKRLTGLQGWVREQQAVE